MTPYQDEPFTIVELKATYSKVDGFYHLTPPERLEAILVDGITPQSLNKMSHILGTKYGDTSRVYLFGNRDDAFQWGSSLLPLMTFNKWVMIEFDLPENALLYWDNNPGGLEKKLAFSFDGTIPANRIITTSEFRSRD